MCHCDGTIQTNPKQSRNLCALIPNPMSNLVRYHGMFVCPIPTQVDCARLYGKFQIVL